MCADAANRCRHEADVWRLWDVKRFTKVGQGLKSRKPMARAQHCYIVLACLQLGYSWRDCVQLSVRSEVKIIRSYYDIAFGRTRVWPIMDRRARARFSWLYRVWKLVARPGWLFSRPVYWRAVEDVFMVDLLCRYVLASEARPVCFGVVLRINSLHRLTGNDL